MYVYKVQFSSNFYWSIIESLPNKTRQAAPMITDPQPTSKTIL